MQSTDLSREETLSAGQKPTFPDQQGLTSPPTAHKKRRSHSRSNSMIKLDQIVGPASTIPSPPRSRPTSHHRRQSSVSTRRESVEVMGVSALNDDHDNNPKLTDSRLRALLALEGKQDSPTTSSFTFTKVELPDLDAAADQKLDLSPGGPSAPSGAKPFTNNNGLLSGKRDSFGKLLASSPASIKKELHTLLEENEGDEEEEEEFYDAPLPAPAPPAPSNAPARHRPTSLKLRPLSLRTSSPLPTPSPTPPLRSGTKLKTLTLTPTIPMAPPKRSSVLVSHSSPMLTPTELNSAYRTSSISHRPRAGDDNLNTPSAVPSLLLTPNQTNIPLTPITDGRGRSPTPEDAHATFVAQSQASLLSRIADLENALSINQLAVSPVFGSADPSEELLEMLSDLKAERDDLKKELDGANAKYADLEKRNSLLSRKIDNERREVWVTKEKLSIAQAEKDDVTKQKEDLEEEMRSLRDQLDAARNEAARERRQRALMEEELRQALEKQLQALVAPRKPAASFDSQVTRLGDSPYQSQIKLAKDMTALMEEEEERVSDGSLHSESLSSNDISFDAQYSVPNSAGATDGFDHHERRASLTQGWSFASASRKRNPSKRFDFFRNSLEILDADGNYVKPLVEVKAPLRQPKVLGLGFGFDLLDENDADFQFGRPVEEQQYSFNAPLVQDDEEQSSFPTPSDSGEEDDIAILPNSPGPLLDDEDVSFSFGGTNDDNFAFRTSSPEPEQDQDLVQLMTPRLTPPQKSPSAVSDTQSKRRSRTVRESVDLRSTNWAFPKSAPATVTTFPIDPYPYPMPTVASSSPRQPGMAVRSLIPFGMVSEPESSPAFNPPAQKAFTFGRSPPSTPSGEITPTPRAPVPTPKSSFILGSPPVRSAPPTKTLFSVQNSQFSPPSTPSTPVAKPMYGSNTVNSNTPSKSSLKSFASTFLPGSWGSPKAPREPLLPTPLSPSSEVPLRGWGSGSSGNSSGSGNVSREQQFGGLRREGGWNAGASYATR